MANKPKTKPHPEFLNPGRTVNCRCTLYGLDDETTEQLRAIAQEIDRMMMAPLKEIDPGNLIHYYSTLEGHFERHH